MDRVFGWLRDALTTAGLFVVQAVLSLRHNWGIGLLSAALAVSLWVYVTDQDDPERTDRISGSIPVDCVNVPLGKADSPSCRETQSVSVRVRAPESVLDGLKADDFEATADLSEVTSDQASVAVRVESDEPGVEIVEISPSQITVRLENVTSRTVPVRAQMVGTPPRGFEASEVTLDPEDAVVTGPESLVGLVAFAEADVNLTGLRTDFQQTLLLRARDEQGGNVQGVNVEPESALVQAEINQLDFSSAFIIRPEVNGIPADGFNATAIQIDPPLVIVTGPAEVFQSIDPVDGVMTDAISISGASADVVRTVALRLPEGAIVDQAQVTVRVVITPARGTFSFRVAPQITNLTSGLSPALTPPTVQVALTGLLPELSAIDIDEIVATLDLSGLEAGSHTVPVDVRAPAGTAVEGVVPAEVTVTLSSQ